MKRVLHTMMANCAGHNKPFVPLSPVAYPKLNYLLEFGLRFSQFGKSGHYLIKVAQEMIRKRREAQRDAAFVKVWSAKPIYISEWACALQTCISPVIYYSELNIQLSVSQVTIAMFSVCLLAIYSVVSEQKIEALFVKCLMFFTLKSTMDQRSELSLNSSFSIVVAPFIFAWC